MQCCLVLRNIFDALYLPIHTQVLVSTFIPGLLEVKPHKVERGQSIALKFAYFWKKVILKEIKAGCKKANNN